MTKTKVKIDNTTLIRDVDSKAILATDYDEYMAHIKRRERDRENLKLNSKLNKILELLEAQGIDVEGL